MSNELDRALADAVAEAPLAASADIRARGNRRGRRNRIVTGLGAITAVTAVLLGTGLLKSGPTQSDPAAAWSASTADPVFQRRAVEVAQAWQTTDLQNNKFVPLEDFTIAPQGGFPDAATKNAFLRRSLNLTVTLPGNNTEATVTFADSKTMTVPVVSAAAAYADLLAARPGRACLEECQTLTVTGATLGQAQIRTSRGIATVPAWQFQVSEFAAPIVRVAVARQGFSSAPSLPPADAVLRSSHGLAEVGEQSIRYRLAAKMCGRDADQPQVWESETMIVIGGLADQTSKPATVCTLNFVTYVAEVTLARPVGNRIILEVVTGQPQVGPTGTVQ